MADLEMLTTKQTAELLKVSHETIRRYTRSGQLPSMKLGGKFLRIRKNDLEAFIDKQVRSRGEEKKAEI